MFDCIIKVIGRNELGLPITSNGKDRPQRSMALPLRKCARTKSAWSRAVMNHFEGGCTKCSPTEWFEHLARGEHGPSKNWATAARRAARQGIIPWDTAFRVCWSYDPIFAFTSRWGMEDICKGFNRGATNPRWMPWMTARRWDGSLVQGEFPRMLHVGPVQLWTRWADPTEEHRWVFEMAMELHMGGYGVGETPQEVYDNHCMVMCN
jgi:hypothetical protein